MLPPAAPARQRPCQRTHSSRSHPASPAAADSVQHPVTLLAIQHKQRRPLLEEAATLRDRKAHQRGSPASLPPAPPQSTRLTSVSTPPESQPHAPRSASPAGHSSHRRPHRRGRAHTPALTPLPTNPLPRIVHIDRHQVAHRKSAPPRSPLHSTPSPSIPPPHRHRRRRHSAAAIRRRACRVTSRFICCEPEASAICSLPQLSNSTATVRLNLRPHLRCTSAGAPERSASTFVPLFRANPEHHPRSSQAPAAHPGQTRPSAPDRTPPALRRRGSPAQSTRALCATPENHPRIHSAHSSPASW